MFAFCLALLSRHVKFKGRIQDFFPVRLSSCLPNVYRVWARGLDSNQSFIEPNLDSVIYGMLVFGPGLIPRPDLFPIRICVLPTPSHFPPCDRFCSN
jgi:hypothetical protein